MVQFVGVTRQGGNAYANLKETPKANSGAARTGTSGKGKGTNRTSKTGAMDEATLQKMQELIQNNGGVDNLRSVLGQIDNRDAKKKEREGKRRKGMLLNASRFP